MHQSGKSELPPYSPYRLAASPHTHTFTTGYTISSVSSTYPILSKKMQSIRSAVRPIARQSAAALSRRGYAEVADGKLALSLVLPHQALYSAQGVVQVNIPAATGDMGILANHVPSVEALRPGVVEVIEDAGQASKKWFGEFWELGCLAREREWVSAGRHISRICGHVFDG